MCGGAPLLGLEVGMRVLLVHATDLDELGGAELSLRYHLAHRPAEVEVDVILPDADVDLSAYEVVVLANLRPAGGLGEIEEIRWAQLWTERLKDYGGYAIRSEYDVHPCTHRDGRCVAGPSFEDADCECTTTVRDAFEALYDCCDAVQFLSPAHRKVIRALIEVRAEEFIIGVPIDLSMFRARTPLLERKPAALILGDEVRVSATAETRARDAGYEPSRIPYLSVPYEEMPRLYNRYQAVVVDPVMFHAFGRIAVEAMSCGCRVLASDRVGAMSWPDPRRAAETANDHFWAMVSSRAWRQAHLGEFAM
jgi:glycosyltransferase involved in cell wall biosynthesis